MRLQDVRLPSVSPSWWFSSWRVPWWSSRHCFCWRKLFCRMAEAFLDRHWSQQLKIKEWIIMHREWLVDLETLEEELTVSNIGVRFGSHLDICRPRTPHRCFKGLWAIFTRSWSSLVGNEGCIIPSGKLLCYDQPKKLWQYSISVCLLGISFYQRAPWLGIAVMRGGNLRLLRMSLSYWLY